MLTTLCASLLELALEYLQCVCNAELLELKDPNTLFRANSLASKSLDNLLKLTSIPYLKSTLQAIVIQVWNVLCGAIATDTAS